MTGSDKCYWHSSPDAAREAGRRGGSVGLRRPAIAAKLKGESPREIARWLRLLADALLAGEADLGRVRCAAYVASVMLAAGEKAALEDLEKRIAALEKEGTAWQ
jgi:hypothetical protein